MPKTIEFSEFVKENQRKENQRTVDFSEFSQDSAPKTVENPSNFGQVFGEFAFRNFVDNILNVPNAAGELVGGALAGSAAGLQTTNQAIDRLLSGEPTNFVESFRENNAAQRRLEPAATLIGGADTPTSFDLEAAARTAPTAIREVLGNVTLGNDAGSIQTAIQLARSRQEQGLTQRPDFSRVQDEFSENREQALERTLELGESNPLAASTGEVAGDVATLVAGRAPIARAVRNRRLSSPSRPSTPIEPGTKQLLDDIVNSRVIKGLKSGGVKVGEAGLEGAVLAALNDEDPLNSSALAAGSQAAGSLFIQGTEGVFGRGGRNLALTAATTMGFIQLFKTVTPGGRDRILESSESAFDKIAALIALGGLASITGFGRSGERLSNQVPIFADAITSIPRGSVLSVLSDLGDDTDGNIEAVLSKLIEDPDFFGPTASRRLSRALTNEKVSIAKTIDSLMADRSFRRKLESLSTNPN